MVYVKMILVHVKINHLQEKIVQIFVGRNMIIV